MLKSPLRCPGERNSFPVRHLSRPGRRRGDRINLDFISNSFSLAFSQVDATSLKANRLCTAIAEPRCRFPAFFAAGRVTVRSSARTRPSTASSMISLSSDDASSFSPSQKISRRASIADDCHVAGSTNSGAVFDKFRDAARTIARSANSCDDKINLRTANATQSSLNETNPANAAGSAINSLYLHVSIPTPRRVTRKFFADNRRTENSN